SPQGFQRVNIFGKLHTHLTEADEIALSVSGFSSAWNASGQIPQRAVDSNLIDRFGSLDDLEGGTTGRQDLNLRYTTVNGDQNFELISYASRYTFKLFSNFTYFLEDPINGDMIEQTDDRTLLGMNGRYSMNHSIGQVFAKASLGGGFRSDDAVVTLWQSPNRLRSQSLVDALVTERNLYLWAQEELIISPMVRMQLGLRGDYFTYNVDDRLEGVESDRPHASGYSQQNIISPKVSLVVSPSESVDLFANFGTSFHSNDARAIVQGRRVSDLYTVYLRQGLTESEIRDRFASQNLDLRQNEIGTLPRAIGEEIGWRIKVGRRLNFATAIWLLDLENEYVYVGDAGITELSGKSRRYGVDIEARSSLKPWLTADADLNLSRGYFVDEPDNANDIPLAPTVTSTGGLTAMHPDGFQAGFRYIHIGDRPANEDGSVTAEGFTLLNLFASHAFGHLRASVTLENILNIDWNEAQFDTESRLQNEVSSVSELHFTPGNPRNIRLGLSYLF
ncbi:MAG: TonB-dependent receptor, partial [Rhodothermales bacterium]|nr:TonB-dependent receptor [Rhodothermales bacterium]